MRKKMVYFGVVILALCAFVSCTTSRILLGMPFWSRGQYTDNDGHKLEKYFVEYSGEISALFSNNANRDSKATLKNLRFSEISGVTFTTPQITGWYPFFNTEEINFTVIFENNEQHFVGTWDTKALVSIPYSDELLNALLHSGVKIHFGNDKRSFKFGFPKGLSEVWETRTNKTNIF